MVINMKITASDCKLMKRLEELGEAKLTLSFDQKTSREGRRIWKELNKRTRQRLKKEGKACAAYYKKHPSIDED